MYADFVAKSECIAFQKFYEVPLCDSQGFGLLWLWADPLLLNDEFELI